MCDLFEKALDAFHVKNDISYLINHIYKPFTYHVQIPSIHVACHQEEIAAVVV